MAGEEDLIEPHDDDDETVRLEAPDDAGTEVDVDVDVDAAVLTLEELEQAVAEDRARQKAKAGRAPPRRPPPAKPPPPTDEAATEAADSEPARDSAATMIGRYQLCFELASGGMAKVYLARAEGPAGFEKLVALKRIHEHYLDHGEFIEMFLDEARIASRINHPNVCTVFDFGSADDAYFIAMEYMLGETAARLLSTAARREEIVSSPSWSGIAMRIVAEACEGLHAAHELRGDRGQLLHVVHRDVSPMNIFVTYDGTVKVMDFGIASAQNRLHTTRDGTIKGRYAYMAPEQARAGQIDRRADVWSLGVVLWEMLTRHRLFKRDTDAETIMALVNAEIPAPSEIVPGLPKELDHVVVKALDQDPDRRWASAREMGRALERVLMKRDEPVGKAEVADLMELLFADRRIARAELVDEARTMRATVIRRVTSDDETSTVELDTIHVMSAGLSPIPPARSARGATIALAGGGVLAGVALTLALTLSLGGGPDAPAPVEAPAPRVTPMPPPAPVSQGGVVPDPDPEPVAAPPPVPRAPSPVAEAPSPVAEAPSPAGEAPSRVPAESREPREPRAEPRERPTRTAPSREPGVVNVVTPGGWAEIRVRGQSHGRTPGRVTLPPGRHVVELIPFGGSERRRVSVTVEPGGTARIAVPLSR